MSSEKSHNDPIECDDEEESASSVKSDEQEHIELFESSENVPMDVVESLLVFLTIHFMFLALSSPIIPFTFISRRNIFFCIKKEMKQAFNEKA